MDPVLRALLAASCKARWCVLRGGGSEAGAAEDGDDLAFDLAAGDWAEVAAVLSALPVIAEDLDRWQSPSHVLSYHPQRNLHPNLFQKKS